MDWMDGLSYTAVTPRASLQSDAKNITNNLWSLGDIIFQTSEYHPCDRSLCIEGQANITALFSGCKYVDSIHLRSQKMRKSIKGRPNTALLFSDQSVTNSVWPLLMDIAMFPFISSKYDLAAAYSCNLSYRPTHLNAEALQDYLFMHHYW